MNYTTIEQSKRLLKLGLDPKTADLSYHEEDGLEFVPYRFIAINDRNEYFPAWSLEALLEVTRQVPYHYISIAEKETWQVAVVHYEKGILRSFTRSCFFDAVYELTCWLLEKGYIKKGE